MISFEPEELHDYFYENKLYEKEFDILLNDDKYIYLILGIEIQVNNGGFSQYLFNSSGKYAIETIDALNNVGAKKTAKLLEKCIEIAELNKSILKRDDIRYSIISNLSEEQEKSLTQLTELFLRYDENPTQLLLIRLKEKKLENLREETKDLENNNDLER